jgi:hypothetical protein
LWVIAIGMIAMGLLSSCNTWQQDMGQDLLPPGDDVFLFHDTIFDIHSFPVTGKRHLTSDVSQSSTTIYLLGQLEDTIVGVSEATLFTQFNSTNTFQPAPNTEIDSILLHLFIPGYEGNLDGTVTFSVYEATERLYMDSLYYSDYEAEGRYNPMVLAELDHKPSDSDTIEILIQDQAFIQKFLDVSADTLLFLSDSLFKDYFNGFYLTATSTAPGGTMAAVVLSDLVSRMTVKYANDSTEVDITAGKDFTWATFGINEYYSQKINMFNHDYSSTYLGGIINKDSLVTPFSYLAGIGGVDTKLFFTNFEEWLGEEKVAVNAATLIFDVLPEEISGIALEDLPQQLMIYTELDDGLLEYTYDFIATNSIDESLFGGSLETVSKGMFSDTTYTYRFNMNLHVQSMVDGVKLDNNFRLQIRDAKRNPKIAKLWSNFYTNPSRIRLEVVYIKL